MSKARFLQLLAALVLLLSAVASVSAQQEPTPALALHFRRDWGYGGIGEIEGNFTISASGPSDLTRVVFHLDDQVMVDLAQPPWQFSFSTGQYPAGTHTLFAVGYTTSGQELGSSETRVRFLSSQQAGKATVSVVALFLGGMVAVAALAGGVTLLFSRGRKAEDRPARSYGWAGGAVCPKCSRPFGLHWWAPNVTWSGKLDRCSNCGRWIFVGRASAAQLMAAEAREQQEPQAPLAGAPPSPGEALARELEDSRYADL